MNPHGISGDATYQIKRSYWSFLDRTFRVYDTAGSLVLFVRHPVLRLREAFNLFADEEMRQPVATVQARQMIAIDYVYDVTDPSSGTWLGTLKSRGISSIVRDTWDVLREHGEPIGKVTEDGHSILRRFFPWLTGHWHVELDGRTVATIDQRFRFFIKEYALTIHAAGTGVDPRFLMACALLALLREDHREERER